ncbi:MAG: sucrase ferredoxin, partial [SAR324 cluster bacterium]|nr:sucrase ferredoxin [SAR324 cluster bacterium]
MIQHPKQTNSEDLKIFAYPERVLYEDVPTEAVFEVLENHLKVSYKNYLPKALSSHRQLFVCTHGRHDQCCAKFGQQLFDTLRESISDTD